MHRIRFGRFSFHLSAYMFPFTSLRWIIRFRKWYFFMLLFHGTGLAFAMIVLPFWMHKYGLVQTLKLYYPLEILSYILLFFLPMYSQIFWIVAIIGGMATFAYWVPLNMLLIKSADTDAMERDLATFFALPKVFGIIGPLAGAGIVWMWGFWPMFAVAMCGIVFSFLPIARIAHNTFPVRMHFARAKEILIRKKKLFFLEIFDNVIEESIWFWGIYVYLVIGTITTSGIVSSLKAIGGALFLFLVGKHAKKNVQLLLGIATAGIAGISLLQMMVTTPFAAYVITVCASFIMTLFLVPYTGYIYRAVKGQNEEEFILLREIPTVCGRMIVFGAILLCIHDLRAVFVLPILASIILLVSFMQMFWKKMDILINKG